MPKILTAPNQVIDVVDSRLFYNPTAANRRGGTADWSDLDLDFIRATATNDVQRKRGPEAVKRSIRNLILTSHFERPFRSFIGSNIRKMLFDNINELTAIYVRDMVVQCITNFEPRANLLDVRVKVSADENGYDVDIVFKVKNLPDPIILTIFLERIR